MVTSGLDHFFERKKVNSHTNSQYRPLSNGKKISKYKTLTCKHFGQNFSLQMAWNWYQSIRVVEWYHFLQFEDKKILTRIFPSQNFVLGNFLLSYLHHSVHKDLIVTLKTVRGTPIAKFWVSIREFEHETLTIVSVVTQNPGPYGWKFRFEHQCRTTEIFNFWREDVIWTFFYQWESIFQVKFILSRSSATQEAIIYQKNLKKINHDFLRFFFQKIFNFWMTFFPVLYFFVDFRINYEFESLIWISKVSIV